MLSGTATLINPLNNRTRMLRYFNGNSILYFSVPHQQANGQLQIKHKNKLKKKHIIMLNKKYKKKKSILLQTEFAVDAHLAKAFHKKPTGK
jgi:hypothetical protein